MTTELDAGLQLRSLIRPDGVLELSLVSIPTPSPGPSEVVVRVVEDRFCLVGWWLLWCLVEWVAWEYD